MYFLCFSYNSSLIVYISYKANLKQKQRILFQHKFFRKVEKLEVNLRLKNEKAK